MLAGQAEYLRVWEGLLPLRIALHSLGLPTCPNLLSPTALAAYRAVPGSQGVCDASHPAGCLPSVSLGAAKAGRQPGMDASCGCRASRAVGSSRD